MHLEKLEDNNKSCSTEFAAIARWVCEKNSQILLAFSFALHSFRLIQGKYVEKIKYSLAEFQNEADAGCFLFYVLGIVDKRNDNLSIFCWRGCWQKIHFEMFLSNIWFQCINYWFVFLISLLFVFVFFLFWELYQHTYCRFDGAVSDPTEII